MFNSTKLFIPIADNTTSLFHKKKNSFMWLLAMIKFPKAIQRALNANQQKAETKKFEDIYNNMIKAIESQKLYLDPRLTQEDVIRYLGTNRKYLYTALKMNCSSNFKGLLNSYRIRHAQSLLKDKTSNRIEYLLSDIYLECGFSTNESFYRTFKNISGISPGKYVEHIRTKLL